jgi:hypothetical protein
MFGSFQNDATSPLSLSRQFSGSCSKQALELIAIPNINGRKTELNFMVRLFSRIASLPRTWLQIPPS